MADRPRPEVAAKLGARANDFMVNRVIARYLDGRVLKGSSLDVSPHRPSFHLRDLTGAMSTVSMSELKGLFFVKSLEGDPVRVDEQAIATIDPRLRGSHLVEVTFVDGEVIVGLCTRYPPSGPAFFLTPVDTAGNNLRVLVNREAVHGVKPAEASDA